MMEITTGRVLFAAPPEDRPMAGDRRRRHGVMTSGAGVRLPSPPITTAPTRAAGRWDRVLGILLDAARPAECGGRAVLRPLWAEETMHRAYSLLQLAARMEPLVTATGVGRVALALDCAIAEDLATLFRSLTIVSDQQQLPCATVLRDVTRNLVALFGAGARHVAITTEVERLSLPAYKRRALVLAASELTVNALRHAFPGQCDGRIGIALKLVGATHARLSVADNGIGFVADCLAARRGIVGGLADLLEADLVYRRPASGGTIAEIAFPLPLRVVSGRS
jgi:hypothetical protein